MLKSPADKLKELCLIGTLNFLSTNMLPLWGMERCTGMEKSYSSDSRKNILTGAKLRQVCC